MSKLEPKFQVGDILTDKHSKFLSSCFEVIGKPALLNKTYYYPVKMFDYNITKRIFEPNSEFEQVNETCLEKLQEKIDNEIEFLENKRVTLLQMNDAIFSIQNPSKDSGNDE
jgi:hypothetical protein